MKATAAITPRSPFGMKGSKALGLKPWASPAPMNMAMIASRVSVSIVWMEPAVLMPLMFTSVNAATRAAIIMYSLIVVT